MELSFGKKKTTSLRKTNWKDYFKSHWQLYLLVSLPLLQVIIFSYVPMYGITIAFKDYNIFKGVLGSEWVGLDVFRYIFSYNRFFKVVRNTLTLNILDIIFGFPAPILLALLLNEIKNSKLKKSIQSIVYLPHFLSVVIVAGFVYQLFSTRRGLVNSIITGLGMEAIPFLTEINSWITIYVGSGVWQGIGWGSIIYLAAISGISPQLYEAAIVDGASKLRRMWHITLPGIRSTIIVLFILKIGGIMSAGFERPYVMGNALVSDVSEVIGVFVYHVGMESGQYSVATAVGLFQSVIGLILVVLVNRLAKLFGEDGIW
ncbi:ABC transporter permease [Vallitalea okinawensis]|uniref:ABC transporter permease n=1 Tax=Vallitalea okinawensis TaxID=2078660 RepID=UPI000CFDB7FC|nr:ABC transporter permease subunit [Vallitalea okinawensis]